MITLTIIISILFSSSAQLLLKHGMNNIILPAEFTSATAISTVATLIKNPFLLAGVGFHFIALILWLYVLKHTEVSYAYPFISLGFVMVAIAGYYLFGESLDTTKLAGIGAIIVGIVLLGRS